jgi:hypothetical protein
MSRWSRQATHKIILKKGSQIKIQAEQIQVKLFLAKYVDRTNYVKESSLTE